jgi:asparagine synthase (glutamine-hydrolysing)
MMQVMHHRGPDEQGFFLDSYAALGSKRLSIIDLASGKQPITNEDGTLWIVFNGEIYNYLELQDFLIRKGHRFKTKSDTEVILHLFEEYHHDCLEYLDGIYAIAIWDAKCKELFLARDRIGIKPLYYSEVDGSIIFGSELKVILAHPSINPEIDLVSLNEYLSYEYVPTPRTILKEIFRLEPGYYLIYNQNGLRKCQYWDVSFRRSESRPPVNWQEYAEGMYDVLVNCVEKELVSDVPVGVLLSGGIDSSTLAALMVDQYQQVDSFTIGFEEQSFDESKYAYQVAEFLGTNHNELILTGKKAVDLVANIMDILDEPFADSSFIPTYFLSEFARQKVKVVLGGDGGDELFAGYPTLLSHRLIEIYEHIVPWSIRANFSPRLMNLMSVSFDNISLDFRLRRFLGGRGVPLLARHHRWLGSFLDEEKDKLLQEWTKPVLRETYYQAYEFAKQCDANLPLNQILYDDMKMYLEGDILYKVDRASMAASLEVRVPFLNRAAVQYITELPINLKLHRFSSKYLLKKCMSRRLPKSIIQRSKKGFNMPVAYWLNHDLTELLADLLSESAINNLGFFNYEYINQLITEHQDQRKDNRKLLWTLLVFQLWCSKYLNNS